MDVQTFIVSLRQLDGDGILAVHAELDEQAASAAGELAWWSATVEIERLLRIRRAGRLAATAATRAAAAVLSAASAAGFELPDERVTAVARAAADVARGLVVEASAAEDLLRHLTHLVAA